MVRVNRPGWEVFGVELLVFAVRRAAPSDKENGTYFLSVTFLYHVISASSGHNLGDNSQRHRHTNRRFKRRK